MKFTSFGMLFDSSAKGLRGDDDRDSITVGRVMG